MEDEELEEPVKQPNYRPGTWRKGQSGNIHGRPKGKTMKEWAKEYLSKMNDTERDDFMHGLSKDIVWKMAEGNPDNKSDLTSGGKPIVFIDPDIANKNGITPSPKTDSNR